MQENPFDALLKGGSQGTNPAMNPFDSLVSNTQSNPFDTLLNQPNTQASQSKSTGGFGGLVGKIGDILSAPQRATTGLETKVLENAGILKPTIQGSGIQAGISQRMSNVGLLQRIGQETGQGGLLTGQYTPTTSVFGNFVRELPSTLIGTVADVFLDPLNFLGGLGAIKKTTGAIGKGIETTAKTVAEEIPAVQKVGDMLGKAFVTRYGQSLPFQEADKARKIAESLAAENVTKLVSPIIEKPAAIQQRVAEVIKGAVTSDSELNMLAQPIRQELDRVGESISKLNPKLLSEDTFNANKGTYFPQLYTKYEFPTNETQTVQNIFGSRAVNIPDAPFKARTLTAEEAKATGNLIEEAGYPALKRLQQLNVVEQRQKFFSEISKMAIDEPRPGYLQMSDDKALGDLAGKFLPAAEYKAITDIRHIPTKTEELFQKGLTLWKTFKTAYNPATIARNDLTNFFVLNPLGGVGPHRLDIYAKTVNQLMTKGPLYQAARNAGLDISTQQAAELTNKAASFYRENKGLVSQFFGKISDFNGAVKDFYGSQDKFFKMANFIKGVEEDGLTPAEAMHRAQFYLVDYSEVPKAVDWLRKSPIGIPFISFTYGVSKPLAKTLLEHPEKLANYFKILNGIQQMNPMGETPAQLQNEKDVLPSWIQEGTYLRLPIKDKTGRSQYVDLQYILPFNIVEAKGLAPNSPIFGVLSSAMLNKDAFTGKEIYKTTDTKSQALQKTVANILGQLLPSATPFVGNSYNKVVDMLKGRPDRAGFVKEPLQVLGDVLGGIKVTPIDPTLEAQKRAQERQREITDLRNELRNITLDKSLFPEEKAKMSEDIQQKIQTAVDKPVL